MHRINYQSPIVGTSRDNNHNGTSGVKKNNIRNDFRKFDFVK